MRSDFGTLPGNGLAPGQGRIAWKRHSFRPTDVHYRGDADFMLEVFDEAFSELGKERCPRLSLLWRQREVE